jgi:WD40 repeat protein
MFVSAFDWSSGALANMRQKLTLFFISVMCILVIVVLVRKGYLTTSIASEDKLIPVSDVKYIAWQANNTAIAVATTSTQIIDLKTSRIQMIPESTGQSAYLAWNVSGTQLAGCKEKLWIWSSAGDVKILSELPTYRQCTSLAWSHDGSMLAVSQSGLSPSDAEVVLWNMSVGEIMISFGGVGNIGEEHSLFGFSSVTWHPNSKQIATTTLFSTDIRIYEMPDANVVTVFQGHTEQVDQVFYNLDGSKLASRSYLEGRILIWDSLTGKILRSLNEPSVTAIAWSPDGNAIASASVSGVKLWNVSTGSVTSLWSNSTSSLTWELTGHRLAISDQQGVHIVIPYPKE